MDYQHGIVEMIEDADALLQRATDAIALMRDRGGHVGYVRVDFTAQQLADRGIDTLILAGISTGGVVLSTVRDGSDRDYRPFVLADATADRDPAVHEFLMDKVFPRQAEVITLTELDALLPAA